MNSGEYTCEVCGGPATRVVATGEDTEYGTTPGPFRYGLCEPCQHLFLVNRPPPAQLGQIYPPTYYTINPGSPLFLRGFILRAKLRADVSRIARIVKDGTINRVLDVGCGDGARLVHLQFSDEVRTRAAREGVHLVEGNVESRATLAQLSGGFDLILTSQLLEHLFWPRQTLARLGELLTPNGLILIETPNWKALDAWLFRRRFWGGFHFPRHFNVFSPESLARLVEHCGLSVRQQGFLPSPGFWIISLRNWLGLNSCAFSRSRLEFINFRCLPVVAAFSLLDTLILGLRGRTSNQYLVAGRTASAVARECAA